MSLESVQAPTLQELAKASGVAKNAAKNWEQYCKACRGRYKVIGSIIANYFNDNFSNIKVLDWGSALGGVSVLLNDEMGLSVTAADVDEHSISWIRKTFPNVVAEHLSPATALPFADAQFDVIFGISVFTHIPADLQEFYISELRRIVTPDGLVILTVKSDSAVENARINNKDPKIHPHNTADLDRAGIIYASYPEKVLNSMDFAKTSDYGITYHSQEYIKKLFGTQFRFLDVEQKFIGRQDVLVLEPISS